MNSYRIISIFVFISAIIQLAFGVFFKLTDMIGEPESTWVFILLCISAVISVGVGIFMLIRSNG